MSLRSALAGYSDVGWPNVWSVVNRCFHGKSRMAKHAQQKNAKNNLRKNCDDITSLNLVLTLTIVATSARPRACHGVAKCSFVMAICRKIFVG